MGFTVLVRADSRAGRAEKKGAKAKIKMICGGKEIDHKTHNNLVVRGPQERLLKTKQTFENRILKGAPEEEKKFHKIHEHRRNRGVQRNQRAPEREKEFNEIHERRTNRGVQQSQREPENQRKSTKSTSAGETDRFNKARRALEQ